MQTNLRLVLNIYQHDPAGSMRRDLSPLTCELSKETTGRDKELRLEKCSYKNRVPMMAVVAQMGNFPFDLLSYNCHHPHLTF